MPHEFLSIALNTAEAEQQRLCEQLVRFGFAVFEVREKQQLDALEKGIDEIGQKSGFRFPPINVETIHYGRVHREAFRALFEIAIEALSTLTGRDETRGADMNLLFSESVDEPFPHGHPYHPTFFNLFNYDHGSLNEHQDRGLITVIFVEPAPQIEEEVSTIKSETEMMAEAPSSLWVHDHDRQWHSADEVIRVLRHRYPKKRYVLLLLGEDGEIYFRKEEAHQHHLPLKDLYAAGHSVRVDPVGQFIERSHHRCDPEARPFQNRRSAALILKRLTQGDH